MATGTQQMLQVTETLLEHKTIVKYFIGKVDTPNCLSNFFIFLEIQQKQVDIQIVLNIIHFTDFLQTF